MRIQVVYSPAARQLVSRELELPEGTTLELALQASGLLPGGLSEGMAPMPPDGAASADPSRGGLGVSVWGRRRPLDHGLRDGDRVEVCRLLLVDPKEARRLRGRRQLGKKAPRAA
jgi:putative ubiquitin-RnfH superfamily antitoxin RatB of RatAB toxin-antitoxin module